VVSTALSTSPKWMLTAVSLNPMELTRPDPTMEQVIATLNAPQTSSSSMGSQTRQDGSRVQMTQTLALERWERAAPKWMCGKLTKFPRRSPRTLAPSLDKVLALEAPVRHQTPLRALVTKPAATSTRTAWVTRRSMGLALLSTPARRLPWSLNSSALPSPRLRASTSKTVLSFPTRTVKSLV